MPSPLHMVDTHWTVQKIPSNTPPQWAVRPNVSAKCLTFVDGSTFMRALATISSVGQ